MRQVRVQVECGNSPQEMKAVDSYSAQALGILGAAASGTSIITTTTRWNTPTGPNGTNGVRNVYFASVPLRRARQRSCASHQPSLAQATRPRSSPSTPQFPAPAIAATTSNPCGRPSSRSPSRHGPPPSSTSIRRRSRLTSARSVNTPPCRETLCRTELVANSEATRIASSACGQPPSHPASAARASPTCRVRRGRFRCDGGCPPPRLSWSLSLSFLAGFVFHSLSREGYRWKWDRPDAH